VISYKLSNKGVLTKQNVYYETALKMFISGMDAQDNFVRASMGKKKSVLTIDAQLSLLDSINYFCFFFLFLFLIFAKIFPLNSRAKETRVPLGRNIFKYYC
jgi:hypothetical protein